MGEEGRLKVVVRVRPYTADDALLARVQQGSDCDQACVHVSQLPSEQESPSQSSCSRLLRVEVAPQSFRDFSFEDVLDESAGQEDVYERSCQDIVESFTRDGKDGCVMCYGQSGSGKTFTMFGDRDRDRDNLSSSPETASSCFGLVQHSLLDICNFVESCWEFEVKANIYFSYYEIDLDGITDLLANENYVPFRQPLDESTSNPTVVELSGGGANVEGLVRFPVNDLKAGLRLVQRMKQMRVSKNKLSNRSHGIIKITLDRTAMVLSGHVQEPMVKSNVLTFFDLACSNIFPNERQDTIRIKNHQYMDRSIFSLNNCIKKTSRSCRRNEDPVR
jgi:hypothetical protein